MLAATADVVAIAFEAYFDFATVVLDVYKTPVGGQALAIVIAANGHHPSGKQYKNEPTSASLLMHGEKDWRDKRLEQTATPTLLFYSHASNGEYRYEGRVLWAKTTVYANSDPLREFTRTSKE